MNKRYQSVGVAAGWVFFAAASCSLRKLNAAEVEKISYADHVLPIFRNSCLNCHNPDQLKAGLDLSSYRAAMAGNEGGKVIEPGNAQNSLLFKVITRTEEPAMPPNSDKLP